MRNNKDIVKINAAIAKGKITFQLKYNNWSNLNLAKLALIKNRKIPKGRAKDKPKNSTKKSVAIAIILVNSPKKK